MSCFASFFAVIFNIYSTDGAFVYKDNMESLILACDGGNIRQAVIECFSQVIISSFGIFIVWYLTLFVFVPGWKLKSVSLGHLQITETHWKSPTFEIQTWTSSFELLHNARTYMVYLISRFDTISLARNLSYYIAKLQFYRKPCSQVTFNRKKIVWII